jgi:hypothetical protein
MRGFAILTRTILTAGGIGSRSLATDVAMRFDADTCEAFLLR